MDNLDCAALEKGLLSKKVGRGREEKGGAEERHVLDFGFPVLMLKRWVWRDGRDDDSPV